MVVVWQYKEWVLESEPSPKEINPRMGRTNSRDTMGEVRLYFASKEEAVAHLHHQLGHDRNHAPHNVPIVNDQDILS